MAAYLAWWLAGGVIGALCGLLVLRHRGVLGWRAVLPFPAAIAGCLYGAKVQHRLRHLPPLDALVFAPTELLAPGYHIPLGLVAGFLTAMLVSRMVRIPLRQVADALAVTGAVLMPIGRMGCLMIGCCTGTVCPTWLHAVCVRPSLDPQAPHVHLLPAYFALLGFVMLAADLWLLRRRVRPGTLIAASFFIYPAGQLAIEPLRGDAADRTGVMTSVLVLTILANAIVSGCLLLRRRARSSASAAPTRVPRLVTAAALALLVWPGGAVAQAYPESLPDWQQALQRYGRDPVANRRELLRLGRRDDEGLPPVFRIALADAHMRAGHLRTAARQFEEILDDTPGEPWRGLAALGRGWIAARRGELDDARDYFADATSAPGSTGLLGDLLVGMLDAGDGAGDEAIARFTRIAEHPDATSDLRLAATMAEGYARLWTGDDEGARATFERAHAGTPDGPLGDDARYAAALAQWRDGDRAGAEKVLRELAEAEPARRGGRTSPGSMRLDPRELVRGGARRYRRLPLRMPADQVLAVLDTDVRPIARAALRQLEHGADAPVHRATTELRMEVRGPTTSAVRDMDQKGSLARGTETHAARGPRFPWRAIQTATVLIALAALWLVRSLRNRRDYP